MHGAPGSQVAYLFDEARKAGIRERVVRSRRPSARARRGGERARTVKLARLIMPVLAVMTLAGYFAERRTSERLRREIDAYGSENRILADLRTSHAS